MEPARVRGFAMWQNTSARTTGGAAVESWPMWLAPLSSSRPPLPGLLLGRETIPQTGTRLVDPRPVPRRHARTKRGGTRHSAAQEVNRSAGHGSKQNLIT